MKYTGNKRDDIVYIRESAGRKNNISDTEKSTASRLPKSAVMAGLVLMAVQLILTVLFIILSINLGIFPIWVMIILILVSLGALAGVFYLEISRKKFLKILGIVISGVLVVMLGFSSFVEIRADSLLSKLTGIAYSVSTMKVAVMADDPAESLSDAADNTFGTISTLENEKFLLAMEHVNNEAGKTVDTYDCSNIRELYEAFFKTKSCNAILYDSSFDDIFEETDPDFFNKVKIIAEFTVKVKVENSASTNADVLNKPFTIWISGNDEWSDTVDIDGRSDVNILCTVNPVARQVLLVTVPRDYYVSFPTVSDDEKDKLTHCGIYGISAQMSTAANLFNLESIDYFVRINFSSLMYIVDAIDGIDLYNDYEFSCTYEDIDYPEGDLHLNGWQALWYARERKALSGGDLERGVHQMQVIEAMIDKLCSSASITHFNALMEALSDFAITNMSDSDIQTIIQDQLQKGSSWDILKYQMTGEESYQPSYAAGGQELYVIVPYQESIDYASALVQDMLDGILLSDIDENKPTKYTLAYDLNEIGTDENPVNSDGGEIDEEFIEDYGSYRENDYNPEFESEEREYSQDADIAYGGVETDLDSREPAFPPENEYGENPDAGADEEYAGPGAESEGQYTENIEYSAEDSAEYPVEED